MDEVDDVDEVDGGLPSTKSTASTWSTGISEPEARQNTNLAQAAKMSVVTDDPRYSRQILFPGIGKAGQKRLGEARVAVIGCGALGTVAAEMLARAGIGRLDLIDRDFVEPSNLQRQSLFRESDARERVPKAAAARRALREINSSVEIHGHVADLTNENIPDLCGDADVLLDAVDNFDTRYLINDFAWQRSIPWVYGGCVGSYGVSFAFLPGKTPCLQCLFPEPPAPGSLQTCDTAGIVAPIVHVVSSHQVAQTLRLLAGGAPSGLLLRCDVWEDQWGLVSVAGPNPDCPCCAGRRFRFLEGGSGDRIVKLCGRNAVQVFPKERAEIDFPSLSRRIGTAGRTDFNEYMMRIDVEGYEIHLFPDGRSIIKGTEDAAQAKSVYARYIGR